MCNAKTCTLHSKGLLVGQDKVDPIDWDFQAPLLATNQVFFLFSTLKPRVELSTKSMRLKYEPSSLPTRSPALCPVPYPLCEVARIYPYMGTSLIRNRPPLGPYSRDMPRPPWWS